MSKVSRAAMAEMIAQAAYVSYKMTLGTVPPLMSAHFRRMTVPRIGDWVLEVSTHSFGHKPRYPASMRVGKLLRDVSEPIPMEWNEAEDGPHPEERVYYIEGLDGVEHRWTNASFIAIPVVHWGEEETPVEESEVRAFQGRHAAVA